MQNHINEHQVKIEWGGNVVITAGEQYKQVGSDVVTPGGGLQIELKNSIQWYIDNGYLKAVK